MQFANFGGLFCPNEAHYTRHPHTKKILYQAGWIDSHHTQIASLLLPAQHPCIISDEYPWNQGYGWINHLFVSSLSWPVILVDNHHHVLPRRCHRSQMYHKYALTSSRLVVIHIDSHADLGPNTIPLPSQGTHQDWRTYTINNCSIATFINPALDAQIIDDCIQIRSLYKLHEIADHHPDHTTHYILDVDCDFWDAAGRRDEQHQGLTALKKIISSYPLLGIGIATSPLFIDQHLAHTICSTIINMLADTNIH
ncbi:MAG: UPF0489 family protein [Candidatus Absconditabacterales bacterium]|nr:UPF0489 family protein [Candidatus Absconditabacterales bacterium]